MEKFAYAGGEARKEQGAEAVRVRELVSLMILLGRRLRIAGAAAGFWFWVWFWLASVFSREL